ncbi:TRAP transporter small permease [Tepidamorphus sp. 3E244]|uniref:TRAP transporter small permease n=1 Tax=Tepidamorphus sp. 3E244 TaxID=3385498 RepID=UPI0038FCB0F2
MSGVLDAYRRVMWLLAITSIAAILLAVGAQVVARYVFGASFRWSDELSRYMLVWITFIFAGIALERGEMIALDLLDRINTRALRIAITLATSIPVLAALSAIVYYGYRYAALNASQSSPTLGISMFTVYLAIPIGLTLLALHVLAIALRDIARQFARG